LILSLAGVSHHGQHFNVQSAYQITTHAHSCWEFHRKLFSGGAPFQFA